MQSNQVISQQPSQVTSGGGTKHKRRRRVRTLKATYGRAYRKYNQMYGGGEVPEPKKEEPGLFTTLTNKIFGSNEDDAKKKAEEEAAAANKKKAEEAAAASTAAVPLEGDGKSLIQKAEDAASGALATVEGKAAEIKDGIVKTTADLKDRATIAASVLVPSTGDDDAKNAAAMDATASDAAEKDAEDDDNKSVSSESSSSDSESDSSSSGSESDNEKGDGDGDEAAAAATAAATANSGSDDNSSLSDDKRRIKELEKKVEMLTTGPLAEAARAAKDAAAAVESAMESMKLAAIAANAASAAASAIAISVNSEKFTNSKATTATSPPPVTPIQSPDDTADAPEGIADAPEADDDTAISKAADPSKEFTDAQSLLGTDEPPKEAKEAPGDTLRGLNEGELETEGSEAAIKKGGKNRHKHRKSNHNGTRKH